ncbi:hypothetical protein AAY473_024586 [Plecturocebus cupreus]
MGEGQGTVLCPVAGPEKGNFWDQRLNAKYREGMQVGVVQQHNDSSLQPRPPQLRSVAYLATTAGSHKRPAENPAENPI